MLSQRELTDEADRALEADDLGCFTRILDLGLDLKRVLISGKISTLYNATVGERYMCRAIYNEQLNFIDELLVRGINTIPQGYFLRALPREVDILNTYCITVRTWDL